MADVLEAGLCQACGSLRILGAHAGACLRLLHPERNHVVGALGRTLTERLHGNLPPWSGGGMLRPRRHGCGRQAVACRVEQGHKDFGIALTL